MSDMTKEEQAELHYLRWFKQSAYFGPADDDVHRILDNEYEQDTGNKVPEGWGRE